MEMIIKTTEKNGHLIEIRTRGTGFEVILSTCFGDYCRTTKKAIYATEKSAKSAFNRWSKNI